MADTNSQSVDARILGPHTGPHRVQCPHADIQHGHLTLTDYAPTKGALNPRIDAPGHQGVEIQVTGSSITPFAPRHHQHQEIEEGLLNLYITLSVFPHVSTCIILIHT